MLFTTLMLLLLLLALALPVAGALGVLGLLLDQIHSSMPLTLALGEVAWSTSQDFLLVAIPMFILLGEILLRAGVAERMYAAMANWLSWLPGGLMHSNIGACTVFAATSGSSVATAATVGTVSLPLIERYGYNERLFLGTLAAGGTLGILIPPSINMIIYAVLTDTSIPRLYLAGIIPGLGMALMFMGLVLGLCLLRPAWGGRRPPATWGQRIASLPSLLPPIGSPAVHAIITGIICAGEITAGLVCLIGAWRLWIARKADTAAFTAAKRLAVVGAGIAALVWFFLFAVFGGALFQMWQTEVGAASLEGAWQFSGLSFLTLLYLTLPYGEAREA